jgi:hypothetical protein
VRSYLFWVDVCTLGADLLAQQLMKKAAREAADGYRAYRSSLGDDALEEADYARNEQAQARREAQEHLDEVGGVNRRIGLASEVVGTPMDEALLKRIIQYNKRYGLKIEIETEQAIEYLRFTSYVRRTKVYGVTLNEKAIYLGQNPSVATVYEELIHARQFKNGRYNELVDLYGNTITDLIMEKEAAETLIKNSKKIKIPNDEVSQIKERLEYFVTELKNKDYES